MAHDVIIVKTLFTNFKFLNGVPSQCDSHIYMAYRHGKVNSEDTGIYSVANRFAEDNTLTSSHFWQHQQCEDR